MRSLLLLIAITGCGGDPATRPRTFGGDRPVDLQVPAAFDEHKSYPLVMVLHGYSASGFVQEAYFGLHALLDADQALVLAPDGNVDSSGKQFWNADPACCDLDHTNPDDSGYLAKVIEDVSAAWPVDRKAVFLIGHSNGGYMAYRMACDHADAIASIVVLAGGASTDPAACQPSQPVNLLHLHGTADPEVPYAGQGPTGMTPNAPGAVASATRWAGYDGCQATTTQGTPLDLDNSIAGAETQPETFGCTAPIDVELWTMNGSSHIPAPTPAFEPALWAWLDGHHRP